MKKKSQVGLRAQPPIALTQSTIIINDYRGFKPLGIPKNQLCERCHHRPATLMVIGEQEGKAILICPSCRERSFLKKLRKVK